MSSDKNVTITIDAASRAGTAIYIAQLGESSGAGLSPLEAVAALAVALNNRLLLGTEAGE